MQIGSRAGALGLGRLLQCEPERDTHRGVVARLDAQTLEFDFSMAISKDE
jgi:hypothetical protein